MKILSSLLIVISVFFLSTFPVEAATISPWWSFQSIDTMKYSRDLARERLHDPSFDVVINNQVKSIAETGATHLAVATPYDQEFVPFLQRWVTAARANGLNVWFRGNFSGWEGWFNYPRITREDHLNQTKAFIERNPSLFENGDFFSPCPECENGGPGDPRNTRDIEGHRQFLIAEYQVSREAFRGIGKNVQSNLNSMNADVARLVMDEKTTRELGGIVSIDHYVGSPEQLTNDVREIAAASKGKVVLGEYGVPIPDIHGSMTMTQQAQWLDTSLSQLVELPELIGVNYWVNVGGSTQLWNDNGTPREGVAVLQKYFQPTVLSSTVRADNGKPLANVLIHSTHRTVFTDSEGKFSIPIVSSDSTLTLEAVKHFPRQINITNGTIPSEIVLEPTKRPLWERLLRWVKSVL